MYPGPAKVYNTANKIDPEDKNHWNIQSIQVFKIEIPKETGKNAIVPRPEVNSEIDYTSNKSVLPSEAKNVLVEGNLFLAQDNKDLVKVKKTSIKPSANPYYMSN